MRGGAFHNVYNMKVKKPSVRFQIGIDEAGRGPLAGPVSVGAVLVRKGARPAILRLARDSKQLSEVARERIYAFMLEAREKGQIDFAVSLSSVRMINQKGIVPAIRAALAKNLEKLGALPHEVEIFLDGALKAPAQFLRQKTIVRGDATVPLIGLASIAAKVERDRHMKRLGKRHALYGFEIHKGYGTRSHRSAIKKHGPCAEHRSLFIRKIAGMPLTK